MHSRTEIPVSHRGGQIFDFRFPLTLKSWKCTFLNSIHPSREVEPPRMKQILLLLCYPGCIWGVSGVENLSKIYRKSIENLSKIYRKSIEHLSKSIENPSKIYRKSIENRSKIYRKSIEKHKNGSIPSQMAWNWEFLIWIDRSLQYLPFEICEKAWNDDIRG